MRCSLVGWLPQNGVGAFLDRLNHRFLDDLDPDCIEDLQDYSGTVLARPELSCYVIADEDAYDRKTVSVREALETLATAYFGVVVLFIPGKLACYRDKTPWTKRVWLMREGQSSSQAPGT